MYFLFFQAEERIQEEKTKDEDKVKERNVFSDPVLEARRRKFESNSPIKPLNKKIRLKSKNTISECSSTDAIIPDKVSETKQSSRAPRRSSNLDRRVETEKTSVVEPDSNSELDSDKFIPNSRIVRTDSNKSLDKACNTDDVLDIGGEGFDGLLVTDEELEREIMGDDYKAENKKVSSRRKEGKCIFK